MGLFRKRSKMPPGTIERGDQVMVPADQLPDELKEEGEGAFTILDEWQGELVHSSESTPVRSRKRSSSGAVQRATSVRWR